MAPCAHTREPEGQRRGALCGLGVLWLLLAGAMAAPLGAQPPDTTTAGPELPAEPAAEAPPATPDESAPAAPAALADTLPTRLEAQIAFTNLVAESNYEEAVTVGQHLLVLTEEEFGENSNQAALVRANVGEIQRRLGDLDAAEANLLAALATIRANGGAFAEAAIAPLVSLGTTYHDANDYLSALSSFNEARTINRRVYGLLNEAQFPIMERMTDTYFSMERIEDADEMQLNALQLAERNRGSNSPEVVEALYRYADWLRRTNRYQAERQQYLRAIDILRAHYGDGSPTLARPLSGIGNSFRAQRLDEGQGLGALRRAREILESQPDPDPLALAEVLRDLGDWSVAFSRVGPTGNEYRRAWQLLGALPEAAALRNEWFRGPEYVLREPVSPRGVSHEADAARGFVLVQFDVSTSGRPENVVVLEAHPPGLMDDAILRSVRRSRFRPQMRDGEILRGEALVLRFAFGYDADDYQQRH